MLAGLSCQVASLLLFAFCCAEFALRVYAYSRTPGHPYDTSIVRGNRPTSPLSIRNGCVYFSLSLNLFLSNLWRSVIGFRDFFIAEHT
jgi:hypothetical protein